tara:strand:- start:170 stop:499 length:330 start_codon:yes stop_codon:yes gene_type:complete
MTDIENNNEIIEDNLEIIQEDIRNIEKQFIIKKDLDQLKRNVHKIIEKTISLDLKLEMTKPKLVEVIKKNANQINRNKTLMVELQSQNKFKIKSVKNSIKKKVEIKADE